ncbi:hypothetical protein PLICRDRAFT_699542, partial [Plicaturopsis crispa FD-325 SS-3]
MASLTPSRLESFAEALENVLADVSDASPATQGRVRGVLKRRVSSLSTSLSGEQPAMGSKKSAEQSKNERQDQIDNRTAAARAELCQPITPPVLTAANVVLVSRPKTKVSAEDQALSRVVRGFAPADTVEWVRLLNRHKAASATFQQRCDASTQIDQQDENE